MNLRVAGIGEERAPLVGAPGGGDVAAFRVGREVEDIAVAAGGKDHAIRRVRGDRAGDHVAHDDAFGVAVHDHEIEHFGARKHLHRCLRRSAVAERGVGAEQKLLAGLAAGVKGARDLRAAEGAIREQAAVFAGKGHALRHALVDDVRADFRQPIHVRFARAEVAALDRVVKKPVNGVAVVLVVLRGIDPALRGDRVRAPRRVLVAKAFHLVAHLAERGRGARAGQAGADDDDLVFPLVRGVDQLRVELVLLPLLLERAGGDFGIERAAHLEMVRS